MSTKFFISRRKETRPSSKVPDNLTLGMDARQRELDLAEEQKIQEEIEEEVERMERTARDKRRKQHMREMERADKRARQAYLYEQARVKYFGEKEPTIDSLVKGMIERSCANRDDEYDGGGPIMGYTPDDRPDDIGDGI
jgi:hypothetical protein